MRNSTASLKQSKFVMLNEFSDYYLHLAKMGKETDEFWADV